MRVSTGTGASLLGRGPRGLVIQANIHCGSLHRCRALNGALVADFDGLAAGVALELELDNVTLHGAGDLRVAENLAVERAGDPLALLPELEGRATRTLTCLYGELP